MKESSNRICLEEGISTINLNKDFGISITDSFEVTKAYHDIFLGIFMGIIGSTVALTASNKRENK